MATGSWDLVVIGAGWYGIGAAKTYLALHPDERILVIEEWQTVGGTWSEQRLYPELRTNNIARRYEYPDFPMDEPRYGVKDGEHIPGTTVHRYLTDVAKTTGVFERIRFNTKVESVRACADDTWHIQVSENDVVGNETLIAKRLIVATGLTSNPNMPKYAGEENFAGPMFHTKHFHEHRNTLNTAKNVVVVGGSKSAYDVAWAYCKGGATIDLVIRPDGNGPVWMSPALVTPLKRPLECLLHTRALSWFSPCTFGAEDGWIKTRNWLHRSWLGQALVSVFWKIIASDVTGLVGWDRHSETKKLKPWYTTFWTGTALGILNYDGDFYDLVRTGKVRIHVGDIAHLAARRVFLEDGTALPADVVVCATGWRKEPAADFFNADGQAINFGLDLTDKAAAQLKSQTDAAILKSFPQLRNQPDIGQVWKEKEPYRLYRFIVPPMYVNKRNIAFVGQVSTLSNTACTAVQALWVSAFFDGQVNRIPSNKAEMEADVMLNSQWGKWRYPAGYGPALPDLPFDCVPYHDLLLNDLGLRSHRKKGFLADLFEPYAPSDYDGLLEEWIAMKES